MIAVYNQSRFVARAIDSILTQTFADFELVVVNDASHDGTGEIVDRYAHDARVRVVHLPANGGLAAALNAGFAQTKAKLIARLDADDIALPDRLCRQVAFLDAHPETGMLGGAMTLIDAAERKHVTERYLCDPRRLSSSVQHVPVMAAPTTVIRRDALIEIGGWRSAFDSADDYDLTLRVSERFGLANLPDVLTYYRIHPQQKSVTNRRRQIALGELARICARYRRQGRPDPVADHTRIDAATVHNLGLEHDDAARLRKLFEVTID